MILRVVLLFGVAVVVAVGCRGISDIPKKIPTKALQGGAAISNDELRVRLNEFAEHFSIMVRGAADTIYSETNDVELKQASLRWKVGAIRGCRLAVRCDRNPPSVLDLDLATTRGDRVAYRLVSVPLYLLWNLEPILEGERAP